MSSEDNPKYDEAPEDEVITSIRLSRRQHAQLKRLAARHYRTLSAEIRRSVDELLERDDNGPQPPVAA